MAQRTLGVAVKESTRRLIRKTNPDLKLFFNQIARGKTPRSAYRMLRDRKLTDKSWDAFEHMILSEPVYRDMLEDALELSIQNNLDEMERMAASDDPSMAKLIAAKQRPLEKLLYYKDRQRFGDHKTIDTKTEVTVGRPDDSPKAIAEDAIALLSDEERAELAARLLAVPAEALPSGDE